MTLRSTLRDRMLPELARALPRPTEGDPDRILILQPDHLGDIILSEPAVRLIRERRPEATLIAVVGPWSAGITRLAWPVDHIVEIDYPGFDRSASRTNPLGPYVQLRRDAAQLGRLGAADSIVLRDDAWWAVALAHASVSRAVVAASDPRNLPFATVPVDLGKHAHNTARALALASALLGDGTSWDPDTDWDMSPHLTVNKQHADEARALLDSLGIRQRYIVMHPGAGAPVKTWPARYWRSVVGSIEDYDVVITGGIAEIGECALIADGYSHATSVAGKTSLEGLAGLFRGSSLAIGTDNGPMHLAAATGAPTIRLFGPSNPRRYGPPPRSSAHPVIRAGWNCPRCEDLSLERPPGCGCMAAITPETVVDEIAKMLSHGL